MSIIQDFVTEKKIQKHFYKHLKNSKKKSIGNYIREHQWFTVIIFN